VSVAAAPGASVQASPPRGGLIGALAGTDHKSLGARIVVVAFAFFLAGGVLAALIRTELLTPQLDVVSRQLYNALFTIHGSTMFYLFIVPMAVGVGVYLVPLQIGATGMAWGRLGLAGFWLVLAAGVTMWSGFLTQGGAAAVGWYGFYPLSDVPNSPGIGTDLWILAILMAGLAAIALAASLLATVVQRRAPGMTMLRLPPFTWTIIVTCLMIVTAFPALIVAMTLLFIQRQFGGPYDGSAGPITYQQLFWFFGHPVVYVGFFPFLGAAAEAVTTFSGKRWFGHKPFVFALLVFAAGSMSVWAHHMFTTGAVNNRYFAFTSTLLLVPAGVEYFDAAATMHGGRIRLTASMLFALGFFFTFLIGGVTGVWVASPPLDYQATDSYFIVAHFHYTLFGGGVLGLFAGIYLWFPKVTGALLREGLGKVHFWLTMVGVNLAFFPMFFLGQDGMPRRYPEYTGHPRWQTLNDLSSAGAYVLALSLLVFIANVGVSLLVRRPAGPDPWGGQTLEWMTDSPPPPHNFDMLPPIRSHAPLLDRRRRPEGAA
jgi:cytochrome c oxidase subunit 1